MTSVPVKKKTPLAFWFIPIALIITFGFMASWADDEIEESNVEPQSSSLKSNTLVHPHPNITTSPSLLVRPDSGPAPSQRPASLAQTKEITTFAALEQNLPEKIVGRAASLNDLRVTRVVGDKSFYVTAAGELDGPSYFVFLDEQPTPKTPTEGRYDINKGDRIGVVGWIKHSSPREIQAKDTMVTPEELELMSKRAIYLHVNKLTKKTSPPSLTLTSP